MNTTAKIFELLASLNAKQKEILNGRYGEIKPISAPQNGEDLDEWYHKQSARLRVNKILIQLAILGVRDIMYDFDVALKKYAEASDEKRKGQIETNMLNTIHLHNMFIAAVSKKEE